MKKVLTTIAISMSALLASAAMAAPNDHRDNRYQSKSPTHWNNDHRDSRYNNSRYNDSRSKDYRQDHRYDNKGPAHSSINPSREWRSGQALPRQFSSTRYEVNRDQIKRLPKAGRNQQWYKINGDYVLVNERNDRILKIIG